MHVSVVVEVDGVMVIAVPKKDERHGYLPIEIKVVIKDETWREGLFDEKSAKLLVVGKESFVDVGRSIWQAICQERVELGGAGEITLTLEDSRKVTVSLNQSSYYDVAVSLCVALKEANKKSSKLDDQLAKTLPLLKEATTKSSPLSEAKIKEISNKRKVLSAVSGSSRARHAIHKGLK